jgi:hypothetical protein
MATVRGSNGTSKPAACWCSTFASSPCGRLCTSGSSRARSACVWMDGDEGTPSVLAISPVGERKAWVIADCLMRSVNSKLLRERRAGAHDEAHDGSRSGDERVARPPQVRMRSC